MRQVPVHSAGDFGEYSDAFGGDYQLLEDDDGGECGVGVESSFEYYGVVELGC